MTTEETHKIVLANIALGHLGTVSMADYNEVSPEGIQVRRQWDAARDGLLRRRAWNFAIKRASLAFNGLVSLTGCATTSGSTTVLCASTSGLSVGLNVTGSGVPMLATVASVTDSTHFVLSAPATATATAQALSASIAPAFGWHYGYALPSDYILALEFNGKPAGTGQSSHEIEGDLLLCDDPTRAQLRYVYQHTDPALWDSSFVDAFTLKLAARIASGITSTTALAGTLDQRAEDYLKLAFGPNNQETRPRAIMAMEDSGWMNARRGLCS